ncbi:cytokine receptor family member b1 isoform X2 [Xiphias gladius]|nr:cytokine receptor family member b1 isoform X2 [Xiphias gladius]XP_040004003.1 cytokine receptor family member b1 isoform X2 [Xiphias gladius]
MRYHLTVQASYNQTLSPESHEVIFTPYEDTKIGPPKLSLAGYGNCIQINMSLPEADKSSGIDDIQKFYDAHFRVWWRREKKVESQETRNKSLTLNNLEEGMEYCVQVHTKIRVNKNTEPSAWECTFTSIVERRDPVVLGAVAALLSLVTGVLMTSMFCLHYTGFLCKLKTTLPRALIRALSQGYTLRPEGTIPDPVSISSEMKKQRKHNNPTVQHPANGDEDDDEEEEEGINVYMDRHPQHSSGESLCWGFGNESENSEPAASGDCGSLTEGLSAEVKVLDAEFEDEAKAEGATVSFMPEEGQTGLQGHVRGEEEEEEEMKEKDEVFDSSGNVNLFSVTLAALSADEEEREDQNTRDSLSEFLKLSDLEPLLLTVPRVTWCEGKRAVTSSSIKTCDGKTQHEEAQEEEEKEEDEEIFGYMAHT